MANRVSVRCELFMQADGTSTTLSTDLKDDPIFSRTTDPVIVTGFDTTKNLPTGVSSVGGDAGPATAVISGRILTITFASPPTAGEHNVTFDLLFD